MTGTGNTTNTSNSKKTHFRIYSTTDTDTDNQNPLEVFKQHYKKLLMHPVTSNNQQPPPPTKHSTLPHSYNNNNNNNNDNERDNSQRTKVPPRKKVKLSRHKSLYTDESSSSDLEYTRRKKTSRETQKRRDTVKVYADSGESDVEKGPKKAGRTKADGDARPNTKENGYAKKGVSNDLTRSTSGKTNGTNAKNPAKLSYVPPQRQTKKTTAPPNLDEEESPIKPAIRKIRRRVVESTSEEEDEEDLVVVDQQGENEENALLKNRLTKRKERRKVLQTKSSDPEEGSSRKPNDDKHVKKKSIASDDKHARPEKKKTVSSDADEPSRKPNKDRHAINRTTTKQEIVISSSCSSSPALPRPKDRPAKLVSQKFPEPKQKVVKPLGSIPGNKTAKRSSPSSTKSRIDKKDKESTLSVAKKRSPKVAVDSERIVRASKSVRYGQFFKSVSGTSSNSPTITLEYPGPNAKEKFLLLAPMMKSSTNQDVEDKAEYGPVRDIIRTIQTVAAYYLSSEKRSEELFGNESEGLIRELIKSRNRREGAQFVAAVEEFNSILRQLKVDGELAKPFGTAKLYGEMGEVPYELVTHVLHQIYSRTVAPEADSLQQYKAFSNNVYGEVNPSLVKIFIEKTGVTRHSSFVDLGCGIGNVVLQVAAQTGCEAYGIEIMEIPGNLALLQLQEFKARMWYYGLPHGRVKIWKGDFLTSPEIAQALKGADVVFVNNYAFDQHLNHTLLQLFLDLKENVRIISLKSFVPENHKITSRNAGSVESILKVKKYPYYSDAVSWTNSGGDFYIHTVDRAPLQRFFEKSSLMGLGNGVLDSYHRPSRSSTRRHTGSSSGGLFG